MKDHYIRIEFSHEQKGIISTSTFTECKHYFLSDFSDAMLASMQDEYSKDLNKAINYALKANSTLHIMIDVSYNDQLSYRLIMDYDNEENRSLYMLTFDAFHHSYIEKYKISKKDAINTLKAFYTGKMIEAARAA